MRAAEQTRDGIHKLETRAGRKFGYLFAILVVGSMLSIFAASLFGRLNIPVSGVGKSILAGLGLHADPDLDPTWKVVVFDIRFSRICLSMLVGMALAVAGTVFQGIHIDRLGNNTVESSTLQFRSSMSSNVRVTPSPSQR